VERYVTSFLFNHVMVFVFLPVNVAVIMLTAKLQHTAAVSQANPLSGLKQLDQSLPGQIAYGGGLKAVQPLLDQIVVARYTVSRQIQLF
jgi:hypothetical protein